jgi:hypothetical protein
VVIQRYLGFRDSVSSMHVTIDGTMAVTLLGQTSAAQISMDIDASGEDAQGTIRVQATGTSESADVIVIGNDVYTRLAGEDWTHDTADNVIQGLPIDLSQGLSADEITYSGTWNVAGRRLYRLDIDTLPAVDWASLGLKRAHLTLDEFYVKVDDEGYPVDAHLRYRLAGHIIHRKFKATYDFAYTFSMLDEPLNITAPI